MTKTFSKDFIDLVSKSRDCAIELGDDCIGTIHFFIADCELEKESSLLKFAFESKESFEKFKQRYAKPKEDLLADIEASLPLTKEAENLIRQALAESENRQQKYVHPCHFFTIALNSNSTLYECLKKTEDLAGKLEKFYNSVGAFDKDKTRKNEHSGIVGFFKNHFFQKNH